MEVSPVVQIMPGTYAVTCADCEKQLELSDSQLPQRGQQLEMWCPCGNVFHLVCERRRFIRKTVQLDGYLVPSDEDRKEHDNIEVIDVSLGGLRFISQRVDIEVGDALTVCFFLDGVAMKWMEQEIVVRNVQDGHTIGAEFTDQTYNADLDLYLTAFNITA